ncbi:NADH dehydrogenase [ubiquinone] 1 alpha subcomplex subunit 3-like [Xyrauchen texanus]|uniref:NADH dehydrogenase [ubiquinone] 1 alpha subcomplex subunit 3-like n=1 Tax=Xyrauchen texanus TaxID=154827 RepID=UPI002241A055|nr:NADH dehydrogenase [ubiquinone] 1 alpha subcomplex subunit 3-like [Xyrauchen texanus]
MVCFFGNEAMVLGTSTMVMSYVSFLKQIGIPCTIVHEYVGRFLKNAWNKEPVVTAACGLGLLACIVPVLSPLTKYTGMLNAAIPYNYPVPVRDV